MTRRRSRCARCGQFPAPVHECPPKLDYEPTAAAVRRFATGLLGALPVEPSDAVAGRRAQLVAELAEDVPEPCLVAGVWRWDGAA